MKRRTQGELLSWFCKENNITELTFEASDTLTFLTLEMYMCGHQFPDDINSHRIQELTHGLIPAGAWDEEQRMHSTNSYNRKFKRNAYIRRTETEMVTRHTNRRNLADFVKSNNNDYFAIWAENFGMPPSHLNDLINGVLDPTDKEKHALCFHSGGAVPCWNWS
jgi:hypothetical protein